MFDENGLFQKLWGTLLATSGVSGITLDKLGLPALAQGVAYGILAIGGAFLLLLGQYNKANRQNYKEWHKTITEANDSKINQTIAALEERIKAMEAESRQSLASVTASRAEVSNLTVIIEALLRSAGIRPISPAHGTIIDQPAEHVVAASLPSPGDAG